MRGILFKPIRIPGLRRSKPRQPRSLRFTILMMAFSAALSFALVGGIYITTYVVTFIWAFTPKPMPKSAAELPLWAIPVCILTPFFLLIAIAWRFRLAKRFARFIKHENKRDT